MLRTSGVAFYGSTPKTTDDDDTGVVLERMNRRRRSSRAWTLTSAIVVLCLLGFGALAVQRVSVSEEEFSEGFAGLSTADESLERDDFGKFLSSYGKPDVDEETLSPPAELGKKASKRCKKLFKACKVKKSERRNSSFGWQCRRQCKANPWHKALHYSSLCFLYWC